MSRLIAFGCSHVKGEGLSDVYDEKQKKSIDGKHSKFAFPQLVAEHLKIPCLNFSQGGTSNKKIWRNVIDYSKEIKPDDIVIIQWTYLERTAVFYNDRDQGRQIGFQHVRGSRIDPVDRSWFEYMFSRFDQRLDLFLRSDHITKTLDCNLHQFRVSSDILDPDHTIPEWVDNKINFTGINDFAVDKALDHSHYGTESHKKFAQHILQKLGV